MDNHKVEPRFPRVPLATICIPWDEHGDVLEDTFREQIRLHLRAGIKHLYVFGTAGEGYAVTESLFDGIVHLFTDEMRRDPDARPMIGLINLSMRTTIERIERCMDRGLRTFQFALPGWGALNDNELSTFFREVLGRFPDAQFLHYNLRRASRLLGPGEYARLSAQYENFVGAKNGTSDIVTLHDLLTQAPALRQFYTELGFPQGCLAGEPGYLMSLTTMNPWLGLKFFEAGVQGDLATLCGIQAEGLLQLELLLGSLGIPDSGAEFPGSGPHMDGAGEKVLAKVLDPTFPLRLLPPYQAATDAMYEDFLAKLRDRLPGWLPPAG